MLIIQYKEKGLSIAEIYGDSKEETTLSHIDLMTYFQMREIGYDAAQWSLYKRFKTLYINLESDLDTLFSNVHRSTRNEINRASKERFHFDWKMKPTESEVEVFCSFYNQFAKSKNIPLVRTPKIKALIEKDALALSSISDEHGNTLCYHAYIVYGGRATSLYSASHRLYRGSPQNRTISKANKYMHWLDMKTFKEQGYRLYDFGGISIDDNNTELQNVNKFKKSFGGKEVLEYKRYQAISWKGRLGLFYLRWKWRNDLELIK